MIECTVNGHKYKTEKLYLEDFKKLGIIYEEKLVPLMLTLACCKKYDYTDKDLLLAIYKAGKDAFNRDDTEFILDLVMNKEHLTIDGKVPDTAAWEKHWQNEGYLVYRMVAHEFIKENLGNFTVLSAHLPQEWANQVENILKGIFLSV